MKIKNLFYTLMLITAIAPSWSFGQRHPRWGAAQKRLETQAAELARQPFPTNVALDQLTNLYNQKRRQIQSIIGKLRGYPSAQLRLRQVMNTLDQVRNRARNTIVAAQARRVLVPPPPPAAARPLVPAPAAVSISLSTPPPSPQISRRPSLEPEVKIGTEELEKAVDTLAKEIADAGTRRPVNYLTGPWLDQSGNPTIFFPSWITQAKPNELGVVQRYVIEKIYVHPAQNEKLIEAYQKIDDILKEPV